jgi:hypothetical protein
VTGMADGTLDGDQSVPVALSVDDSSSDDAFDGLSDQAVDVTVKDTDVQTYTAPTATGTGEATLSISGGTCALDLGNTAFIGTDGLLLPPNTQFPEGTMRFRVTGCTPGTGIAVNLTFPDHWTSTGR